MASVEPFRLIFEKGEARRILPFDARKLRPPPPAKRARP